MFYLDRVVDRTHEVALAQGERESTRGAASHGGDGTGKAAGERGALTAGMYSSRRRLTSFTFTTLARGEIETRDGILVTD